MKTVNALRAGIYSIFNKIGCASPATKEMLGDDVTETNMMQYLGIIEQRTNEILQQFATTHAISQGQARKRTVSGPARAGRIWLGDRARGELTGTYVLRHCPRAQLRERCSLAAVCCRCREPQALNAPPAAPAFRPPALAGPSSDAAGGARSRTHCACGGSDGGHRAAHNHGGGGERGCALGDVLFFLTREYRQIARVLRCC